MDKCKANTKRRFLIFHGILLNTHCKSSWSEILDDNNKEFSGKIGKIKGMQNNKSSLKKTRLKLKITGLCVFNI